MAAARTATRGGTKTATAAGEPAEEAATGTAKPAARKTTTAKKAPAKKAPAKKPGTKGEDGEPDGPEGIEGELDSPDLADLEEVEVDVDVVVVDETVAEEPDADDDDDEESDEETPAQRRRGAAADKAAAAKSPDSPDFVWDEEESEALRQARKDAELTASADSVRAYLKQIGKVALLNAEEEVELAKRIEAGLYAAERVRTAEEEGEKLVTQMRRDLKWIVRDGERA
ncbi:MAG: polymerase primary sigma factor, partial [Actinomycetota bacterium]|nr:polymerase primary sigma factor [Actinomycetota bacterium]